MQKPDFGDNNLRRICRGIVSICESDSFKYVFRHIFLILPLAFASWVFQGSAGIDLEEKLGSLGEILSRSSLTLLVCAWAWVTLCKSAYSIIRKYAGPKLGLNRDQVLMILQAIYRVVAPKADRMRSTVKNEQGKKLTGSEIFQKITKPDEQLKLLTKELHGLFELLDTSNANWKTRLCRIEAGKPVEWHAFEPAEHQPRTDLDQLGAPTSALSRCIEAKDLYIVADVESGAGAKRKDDRRCILGRGENKQGSLLCAPLSHPNNDRILFVLCISCNVVGLLNEADREYYQWLLDHFFARFTIESALYTLKREVLDDDQKAA